MSDEIKHECGIAFIRLKKPLSWYGDKYGSALYGIKKMQLIMAKQLQRGQDGAGIGVIKLDPDAGDRYIARKRNNSKNAVADIFEEILEKYRGLDSEKAKDTHWLKKEFPYAGELIIGHNRYATHSGNSVENLHPFLRQNNWMSRNLVLAGNYNMTNVDDLFQQLVELGQHPKEKSDNVTMLEKIGHFLDEENERIYRKYRQLGYSKFEISGLIKAEIDLEQVLKNAFRKVDGGYNLVGLVGDGNAFVIRDPAGIRPSYYYEDEEVFVVTSERPAIQTAFNVDPEAIYELEPGCAVIINREGVTRISRILEPEERRSCSFERIYFSRGNDMDIYRERKALGRHLSGEVLRKINFDVRNTVFSYIPNTAATSFYGMIDGIHRYLERYKREEIIKLGPNPNPAAVDEIIGIQARREKILIKDVKMRTFITQDKDREDLVGYVYDVTYGIVQPGIDTLVVIDDSIVRGTTLKQSILKILDRLQPAKIVVASSAPIIKYPDCYGIDMSRMHEFVAFQALLELLKRNGLEHKLQETYEFCLEQMQLPAEQMENGVQRLYNLFSDEELTAVISELLTPKDLKAEVKIIFQTVENLHKACPGHTGDWYFTGNYPTPGGTKVVNRSFVYFMQGNKSRAY